MWRISSVCSKSRQICDTRYLYMIGLELLDNWKINLQLWRFSRLFEFFAVRTFRITVEAYIRLEFVEHLCLAALVFIYLSIFIHVHCSSSIVPVYTIRAFTYIIHYFMNYVFYVIYYVYYVIWYIYIYINNFQLYYKCINIIDKYEISLQCKVYICILWSR